MPFNYCRTPPEDWSRILSASVAPVVIISACGLLCLAFYNRLASVVSRLRAFQRGYDGVARSISARTVPSDGS